MAFRLLYHPDIKKHDLPRIPRNIKEIILRAIEERLAIEPLAYGEPLRQSLKGYRKLRVGDYRILYRIENQDIIILKIGHRNEVYSQVFSRLSG
ncbi:MAG: type II toxin-antitoxin system RelE/ParE family toxin [Candidatus Omnitrophota bacterium]